MLDFGEAVRQFYRNYTNPDGRAQRSAFWWVQLYQVILILVFIIVILMADGGYDLIEAMPTLTTMDDVSVKWTELGSSGKTAIYGLMLFSLVNFLPSIMLNIRRFHDLDQPGWWVLGFFIAGNVPVFGILASLANLIWFSLPGTQGANKYGPDPLH